jgi:hypothetical protein
MGFRFLSVLAIGLTLAMTVTAQDANPAPPQGSGQDGGSRMGQRGGRGWGGGGMMGGFGGVMGTVTEVGTDHYTIKNEAGEIYTVHFSVNTRILKQPARRQGQGAERTPPVPIKASDIKVGDAIAANGEVDAAAKSVGAVFVVQLDPERAKQMLEMQANFGKTWLVGKVTAINDVKVTLQSPVDNAVHTFVADENTSFRKRREPITLADVQVTDNVRVEGALKDGVFVATTVSVMGLQATGGPAPRPGPPPQ